MRVTKNRLRQIIVEEISQIHEATPDSEGIDNDGDGEVDEEDEGAYFSQGGTVSEFISYLQTLDGNLPVDCAIAEGPYLMALASCSFAVIQAGEGTSEVPVDKPTFMILCEP